MTASNPSLKRQTIENVAEYLSTKIASGEFVEGDRLPSRSVLARQFGLSTAAVSIAIKKLADRHLLEFVPGKGVFLSAKETSPKTFTIGLIGQFASHMANGGHPDGPYAKPIVEGIVRSAGERNCVVSVFPETREEPLDIDRIEAHGADCLICEGLDIRAETVLELRRRGLPLLLISQVHGSLQATGVSCVYYNVVGAIRRAVRLFFERGHRRIAYLFAKPGVEAKWTEWRDTFYAEAATLGLHYPYRDYCRIIPRDRRRFEGELSESLREETVALLGLPEPPTAIFYSFYWFGYLEGAMEAVAQRGLTIGKDLSVLCKDVHGNPEEPPVSALVQQPQILGRKLIEAAKKLADDPYQVFQIDIPLGFVDRGSIATIGPDEERRANE